MFPTTPYYWNSSTYSWVPNPYYTASYYPNGAPHQWNAAPYYPPVPTIPNYSYTIPTTGYNMNPYASLNQGSYSNYVNYYSANNIPITIPMSNPAQFPGNMPMPPPPMPAAPTTLALPAPPATPPMPAAPSPPTVAVQVKKEPSPVNKPVKVKEEPVEDTPHICSNCKTTDASEWKNVISKDNILCKTCFDYRRTHKKDRPTMKIHVKKEMKTIKSE